MTWTSLTNESKKYCSYQNKTLGGKLAWWFEYIFRAAPRFWWYTLRDKFNCGPWRKFRNLLNRGH